MKNFSGDMSNSNIKSKKIWKLFFTFIITFLLITFFYQPLLIEYGYWMSPKAINPTSDIVISQNGSNGRLATAIQLKKSGVAKSLGVVATSKKFLNETLSDLNTSHDNVYYGQCLNPTSFDDAVASKALVESIGKNYHSVLVVTDKYVSRRILMLYKNIFGKEYEIKVFHSVYPVFSVEKELNDSHWWKFDVSRNSVFSESQKILFYWLYYDLLGKREGLNIPFEGILDWLSNWRAREPDFAQKQYEDMKNDCSQI